MFEGNIKISRGVIVAEPMFLRKLVLIKHTIKIHKIYIDMSSVSI